VDDGRIAIKFIDVRIRVSDALCKIKAIEKKQAAKTTKCQK
jgi:hypothetical protein